MQVPSEIIKQTEERYQKRTKQRDENLEKIKKGHGVSGIDTPERIENRIQRLSMDPLMAGILQERVLGQNNIMNVNYLKLGLEVAKTVGRITIKSASGSNLGFGTGFMVSPALIMTNNHVLEDKSTAQNSLIEFNYEYDKMGKLMNSVYFDLQPDKLFITDKFLDYTLVAVSQLSHDGKTNLSAFGWNRLIEEIGKLVLGEEINIIQHPNGMPKQIAIRDNQMIDMDEHFMLYKTDTAPGSSGSVVCNDQWEVVGLHHSGVPEKEGDKILLTTGGFWRGTFDNHLIKWKANEGVRISRIVKKIKEQVKTMGADRQKLVEEMLSLKSPIDRQKEQIIKDITPADSANMTTTVQGGPSGITIPMMISVSLGGPDTATRVTTPTIAPVTTDKADSFKPKESARNRFELYCSADPQIRKQAFSKIRFLFNETPEPVFTNLSNDKENSDLKRFYEVFISNSKNTWDIARDLEAVDGIQTAEPDLKTKGISEPEEEPEEEQKLLESSRKGSNRDKIEENFPGITRNWNHKLTNFDEAVRYSKEMGRLNDSTGIRIAQIDTGYSNHPEIKIMNKEAGYDYKGDDDVAFDDKGGLFPQQGHGTRTGSIVIGTQTDLEYDDNEGVFPYVDFVPFRVANSVIILGTHRNVSRAVVNAVNKGFDIITMSMGSVGTRSWDKLAEWTYNQGVLWACAAGNEVRFVVRPAAYPGTIAIAAVDYKKEPWSGSSRGKMIDIAAPGHNIYVPTFTDGKPDYSYGSGTSYATPHIAAAAALWLNHHREEIEEKYTEKWQKAEAFRILVQQTSDKPAGWETHKYGDGILDALALLKADLPSPENLKHAYFDDTKESVTDADLSLAEKEMLFHAYNTGFEDKNLYEKIKEQSSETTKEFIESLSTSEALKESNISSDRSGAILNFIEERF